MKLLYDDFYKKEKDEEAFIHLFSFNFPQPPLDVKEQIPIVIVTSRHQFKVLRYVSLIKVSIFMKNIQKKKNGITMIKID